MPIDPLTADLRKHLQDARSRRVEALSLSQSLNGVEAWRVEVDTSSGSWVTRDERTGTRVEFDGKGTLRDADGVRDVGASFRPHPSVQLLFPERLFVWGDADSDWVPSWSEPGDDGLIVIVLRHRSDRALFASLTYGVEQNLLLRFDSPSNSVHLREVRLTIV